MVKIEGVLLTPLKIIEGAHGNVLHALKNHESSFTQFGEAYFSSVKMNAVKGWKKHQKMTLNIVVPVGVIQFVLFDDRKNSQTYKLIDEIELSVHNYQRLTVPPGIWMAFKGKGDGLNLLLNIASIPHEPSEADNLPIDNNIIPYQGFRK
jgi:dTDP-4-dehydrorhamnose 3,5-epimerase